ncbi:MAG: RNA methyltransferase [Saprospiraceae bacterium]|nr:RNA methyltransferase [Saprospiraceae bacterium]
MVKSITSLVNPLIKEVVYLSEKSKARKESGSFIVEGRKEILMAIKAGFKPMTMIFNPSIVIYNTLLEEFGNVIFDIEMVEVTNQVYNKIAYREGTEGVIAIFKSINLELKDVKLKTDNPLILIAEAPEKPGNIGALMRTADAAGVDLFILANPNTDIFNPNIIRSSVGCVFTNHVVSASTNDIIVFLKNNNIKIYCASITASSTSCYDEDFTGATAIVVGTESSGLSMDWIKSADVNIMIPMKGQIDSMNVSVSAAILIFEAVRQRIEKFNV